MKKSLLFNGLDRRVLESEVDEELQFHIEMQARDYERQGLAPEESLARAAVRFGDLAEIRRQCVRIGTQNSAGMLVMKILFTSSFLLGGLVRALSPETHVTQVGNVLMMIGVLGLLLLFGKRVGATAFKRERESIQLGLSEGSDTIPVSFDEKGRTPFDRVRGDDF